MLLTQGGKDCLFSPSQKGQHMEEFLQSLVEMVKYPAPQAKYAMSHHQTSLAALGYNTHLLMYVCLVPSPQTVTELTAAVETNKETVERYLQARQLFVSPDSPPALCPDSFSLKRACICPSSLIFPLHTHTHTHTHTKDNEGGSVPQFQKSSVFRRMWRRTCLNPRLTGMEYRQTDLAQNEPVSFLHRPKPWLKQISLGGRTVCVVCPIVSSVYWRTLCFRAARAARSHGLACVHG